MEVVEVTVMNITLKFLLGQGTILLAPGMGHRWDEVGVALDSRAVAVDLEVDLAAEHSEEALVVTLFKVNHMANEILTALRPANNKKHDVE
ncbi:hypothetical protein BDDG_12118 [Blastomyces dermatitidis ATCC 18188]|uniref:Uncharacterized protein n=1 Tax=Ajellomyces dermatitidis (strain ATCC 18188 / CBS 674.68) TaxID=653446 RepID=A0A0J9EMV8_AJEDA|nr:hypothetical protein BDDG_12118 [Blastomyces dermatitidis ATCC 18188]